MSSTRGPAVPVQGAGRVPGRARPAVVPPSAPAADQFRLRSLTWVCTTNRIGVKTPALYNHVTSQAQLVHRIAILATTELADAIRDATQGRAGSDALAAGAQAMRMYVREHPGGYEAGNAARPTGPDDPLMAAARRVIASWAAMLRGYRLDPDQEIRALRMLRSMLHGFATLEAAGGFQSTHLSTTALPG